MNHPRLTARQRQFLNRLDRDGNRLVDCLMELQNNAQRGEERFLRANLKSACLLGNRISRRWKTAQRILLNGKKRR